MQCWRSGIARLGLCLTSVFQLRDNGVTPMALSSPEGSLHDESAKNQRNCTNTRRSDYGSDLMQCLLACMELAAVVTLQTTDSLTLILISVFYQKRGNCSQKSSEIYSDLSHDYVHEGA